MKSFFAGTDVSKYNHHSASVVEEISQMVVEMVEYLRLLRYLNMEKTHPDVTSIGRATLAAPKRRRRTEGTHYPRSACAMWCK